MLYHSNMEFKRCCNCNNIIESNKEICTYCGSTNFCAIDDTSKQSDKVSKTKIGGTIIGGFLLGLLLGLLGFFISCCTIKGNKKENWKTFIGSSIGMLSQWIVFLIVVLCIGY